jgi:hypothetical protein
MINHFVDQRYKISKNVNFPEFKTNITKGLGYWLNGKLDSSLLGVSNLVIKPDFKV